MRGQMDVEEWLPLPTPQHIEGLSDVDAIALGGCTVCVLSKNEVYCWGENWNGTLGPDFVGAFATAPIHFPELSGAKAVAVGGGFVCAVVDDVPLCWGTNWSGQLGRGSTNSGSNTPELAAVRPPTE